MKALLCGLATPGLLFPLIGIAERLREQGWDCAFVTDLAFEDVLRTNEFRRVPRGKKDGPSFDIARWAFPGPIAMQVKHIEYALTLESPDVIVANQLCLGAMIVAEHLGIPLVVVGLAAYLYRMPNVAYDKNARERKMYHEREMLNHLNTTRALFHYPPVHEIEALLGDALLLQCAPSAFRSDECLPSRVRCVGALLWEPPSESDAELLEVVASARQKGQKVYLVQMARSFYMKGLWPKVVNALGDEPATFLAATSRLDDDIGVFPPNVVQRTTIPQSAILPHVDGVITGGHTTSVLGAIVHGKPLLSVVTGSGTFDTADLCHRLGNAVLVDGRDVLSDPCVFAEAFRAFAGNDALLVAAREAQRAFAQIDSFGEAARIVQEVAATRRPALLEA